MKRILFILLFITTFCQAKSFKIDGGTFDLDIYFYITDDTALVRNKITEIVNIETDSSLFDARGLTLYNYSYPIVVWFPKNITDPALINHELLHVVVSILNWANIPLSNDTEEIFAYELQYITNKFYINVR